MKLSLLEDGVLDYKGNAAVLATPNAVPSGTIGANIKPAPKTAHHRNKLERHIKDCPQCAAQTLCDVGKLIVKNL